MSPINFEELIEQNAELQRELQQCTSELNKVRKQVQIYRDEIEKWIKVLETIQASHTNAEDTQ